MNAWLSRLAALLALFASAAAKDFAPLTIASGLAEQYTVCHWTMEDGLPENNLQALCFTSDGFLWCVGEHRIVRFDGARFVAPPGLPGLQPDDVWLGATEDHAQRLWIYGTAGAFRVNGAAVPQVLRPPHTAHQRRINWMQGAAKASVWAAKDDGLLELDSEVANEFAWPWAGGTIRAVAEDGMGQLWVAAPPHLARFTKGEYSLEDFPPDMGASPCHLLAIARDGTVWAASGESLFCKRQGPWETVPVPEVARGRRLGITSLFAAPDGALWVGTESTLYQVRFGLWPEALQNEQTPIRRVNWIGMAPDGSLCLAGSDGLRQLRRRNIRTFRTEEPLRKVPITALATDAHGNLLAGVANVGLLQTRPAGDLALCPLQGLPERLPITALATDHDGALWVGTQGDYLWHWHDGMADPILGPNINALLVDHTGRLLVGTDDGLKQFVAHHDQLLDVTNATGRVHGRVNALLEDRAGRIWIGTQFDGMHQLAGNGALTHCASGATILALHEDSEGIVWAGTPAGLERWQGTQHALLLPAEYVAQILDDHRGYLWLGLRRGLARISKAELRDAARNPTVRLNVRVFGVSEGFPDAPCTSGSGHLAVKSADGKLWFATHDGVAMVDPWRVSEPPAESLRVYMEEVRQAVHDVDFHFTTPCFAAPEAVRFSWRLEGFENTWTEPGFERHALYSQLPPGAYSFQVRAALNGLWSPPAVARIEVVPLFWQTWWWRALMFMAGAGVVALVALGLYRWRVRRQQQMERLRLRIARDLHDEIGSNLGGIALLLGVVGQPQGAEALHHIRAITQQSIETLKELVWMIDPIHDSLADMVQRMRDVAAGLLQNLPYEFNATGVAAQAAAPLEVRRNVLPIFKEALHNIIKHAHARKVEIALAAAPDKMVLTVRDDGAGFVPADAPAGHGLRNMQRRVEEFGGNLKIVSQPGQGTTIRLEVPL